MRIVLESCEIRSLRRSDAVALAHHANDRRVWINLRDLFPHPYSVEDAAAFIAEARAARPEAHFAVAVDGQAVGTVGLEFKPDVYRRSAEIGYWLGHAYWGRGIATAAVRALVEHAFARFDLCRISAEVFAWNPASMRVLEKNGFAREGCLRRSITKDGHTIDAYLFALVRA